MPGAALPATALVADIVYNPPETPLLAAARGRGNRVCGGWGCCCTRPGWRSRRGSASAPEIMAEIRREIEGTI